VVNNVLLVFPLSCWSGKGKGDGGGARESEAGTGEERGEPAGTEGAARGCSEEGRTPRDAAGETEEGACQEMTGWAQLHEFASTKCTAVIIFIIHCFLII